MDKAHKAKIKAALELCEERFDDYIKYVNDHCETADVKHLKNFLLDNTVFAGGVFRSIFTDMPVNDVDMFFTSHDAANEFKHMMLMNPYSHLHASENSITEFLTFIHRSKHKRFPHLSIITRWADAPDKLIESFDFSFNQHYFKLSDFSMKFDVDTFKKVGYFNVSCRFHHHTPMHVHSRAMRFMNSGFRITSDSMSHLASRLAKRAILTGVSDEPSISGGSVRSQEPALNLSLDSYTHKDYFGSEFSRLQDEHMATQAVPTRLSNATTLSAIDPATADGSVQIRHNPSSGQWEVYNRYGRNISAEHLEGAAQQLQGVTLNSRSHPTREQQAARLFAGDSSHYVHESIAVGYGISRQAVEDNLYPRPRGDEVSADLSEEALETTI
ncbi:MAG TPA: hypothetical protein VNZ45_10545, partial [Bacteroidia bacterium]|nr:hypothetical protein [Bacteroidia bacterium]